MMFFEGDFALRGLKIGLAVRVVCDRENIIKKEQKDITTLYYFTYAWGGTLEGGEMKLGTIVELPDVMNTIQIFISV
jgi:hypothetical protein